VLDIYIEPRRTLNLKQAVIEAIENGEYETLQSDIRDCFTDEQVELVEEVLESGDIDETIDDIVTEWAGDDLDDLIETVESYFADASIQIHFEVGEDIEEEEDGDDLDDFDDTDEVDEPEGEEEEGFEEVS
jgi:hypothetical protein